MTQAETLKFLAFDLGAESGRAIAGHFDGQYLKLEELHRFANGPVRILDSLYWDVLRLWGEIKHGLARAAQAYPGGLASLGVDTWGVDFALLAADDTLLGNPYHYRDQRTNGMMELAFQQAPRAEIYAQTGIQFIQLNSLYQLLAMARAGSPALATASAFLTMPDLFNFWLSGRKASEFTIATTTQCYNPFTGEWAWDLLERLGVPTAIFQPVVPPGAVLETLLPSVAEETGCGAIPVVAPATHDTGSAVAAVPAEGQDYIYISSGTWSLMGAEIDKPLVNERSLAWDFTNEGGVGGKFRLLKNIMGMWLLQECRRTWARSGQSYAYDQLTDLAEAAPAFGPLVLPGDPAFLPPGDMPARLQAFCQKTGQEPPQSPGAIVRCILESLALEYRWIAAGLEELLDRRLPTIHIIGGGSRNRLLNQFTADATARTVVAGPVEATAIGNLLVQAMALGHVASLAEARAVVRRSFQPQVYEPGESAAWEAAYERYLRLKSTK